MKITSSDKEHNHPPGEAAVEIATCRSAMKQRAATSRDKPGIIVAEAMKNLSER